MDGSAIIQSLSGSQPENHISVDMYTRTTTANMTPGQNDSTGGGDGPGAHNRRKQERPSRIETSIKGDFDELSFLEQLCIHADLSGERHPFQSMTGKLHSGDGGGGGGGGGNGGGGIIFPLLG
ncbi:unnamed protein product [Taenia asiatica]|uniref:Uncharacterized protein n=1 Tax=Taenia asiatica TaxID=60517 RepID=A0A0R3VV72_TAEAS|nr:unnamed protein product [Taenia asiatica]